MKGFAKKKLVVILAVILVLAGLATAGILVWKNRTEPQNVVEPEREYSFYSCKVEDLGSHVESGVMLVDCDSDDSYKTKTNATAITRKGKYVQGLGAMKVNSLTNTTPTSGYFEETDITAYKDGSLHISMYVNNVEKLTKALYIELTSSGGCDVDELQWNLSPALLENGWNDLYLGFQDAHLVTGEIDYSAVNFYRIFTTGAQPGLEVILDCICATETEGMSLEVNKQNGRQNYASTKPGYLFDADSLDGLTSSGTLQLSTAKGEYKEGDGAVIITNPTDSWLSASLQPVDLTKYDGGKLSFWVYVNNSSYLGEDLQIELSSSGKSDKNEVTLTYPVSRLKTGWNEVTISLSTAAKSSEESIDMTSVSYFRMFSLKGNKNLVLIMDGVKLLSAVSIIPEDGLILSCDTLEGVRITGNPREITTASGEYKQGSGALKAKGNGIVWYSIQLEDKVDISEYTGGAISMWLYVDDVSKLQTGITVEIGSAGHCDEDEYEWSFSSLQNGWNQIQLDIASAAKNGKPNLSKINFIRVFCAKMSGEVTTILDEVRAVREIVVNDDRTAGEIADCDSIPGYVDTGIANGVVGAVTKIKGESVEGTGAIKQTGKDLYRFRMKFKEGYEADISEYNTLHLNFYVNDTSYIKHANWVVGIGSGGTNDKSEKQFWNPVSELKNGWNEIELDLSGIKTVDFTKINYIRIFTPSENDEKLVTIVDDIRAVKAQSGSPAVDDRTAGELADCDNVPGYVERNSDNGLVGSVTNADGEFVEGTGAIKQTGKGLYRFRMKFKEGYEVDISEYNTLHLNFYVNDTSYIKHANWVVGIGSGGTNDKSEKQFWKPVSELKNGWNEIEIDLSGITQVDFAKINYIRIFTPSESDEKLVTIVDDIRAVKKQSGEEGSEEETKQPGEILDFDSLNGLSGTSTGANVISVTTAEGEYKEGTGAVRVDAKEMILWRSILNTPVDISAYADGGLHLWLRVEDVSKLKGSMIIELGSDGAANYTDTHEYQWCVKKDSLKSDEWIELYLPFSETMAISSDDADLTKINWLRIFIDGGLNGGTTFWIDDVRAVVPETPATSVVIANCDETTGISDLTGAALKVTTAENQFKEGTGALICSTVAQQRYSLKFANPINVSACAKNGKLHFWFYIEDTAKLNGNLGVELSSGGNPDKDAIEWTVRKANLKNGWNEMYLDLASPNRTDGTIDYTKINCFRIYQINGNASEAVVTIVDDIRIVKSLQLLHCDSTSEIVNQASQTVTTDSTYIKEGTGAFLQNGQHQILFNSKFANVVDATGYEDGKLHMWLYVEDVNAINTCIAVELTSSGTNDQKELQWLLWPKNLQNGWNELSLSFAKADKTGVTDFSNLNFMRIFMAGGNSKKAMITCMDDISVMAY